MEKVLPKNWVETELQNLAQIQSGGTPSRSNKLYWDGDIPWLKISDFKNLYINKAEEFITEEGLKNSSARVFPIGTILFTIFASIGKIGILNFESTANQAIAGISPNNKVNHKYLVYSLKELSEALQKEGKGVAQKNINQQILKETRIPLPPLPEQERIVAKLDALFAQHEVMKKALEHIPQLLKDFRQQVLTKAVTGKLTEEWRKGKELAEWNNNLLKDVCTSISDGDHQAPPKSESGIPFLVISDISSGELDLNKSTRFVPDHYFQNLKDVRVPKLNDLLYTVTGSFGIPVVVNTNNPFAFQRHIGIIKPNKSKINELFLFYFLKSNIALRQAKDCATGTAQLTVPLSGLRNFTINTPPTLEQNEIISRVESLLAKADIIETRYQKLKTKIGSLPQAILYKAFKGELALQLPTDGDAKDLLAEIMALKSEVKGKKK